MGEEILAIAGAGAVSIYLAAVLQEQGAVIASQHLSLVIGAAVLGGVIGLLFLTRGC